jgi:hypothetical protein
VATDKTGGFGCCCTPGPAPRIGIECNRFSPAIIAGVDKGDDSV